jgi:translation initiation factor IF-1
MEVYACVTGLLGGTNCAVKCVDGQERLCIIRGKFRGGRGKRGNMLCQGTWVLVGAREWSEGASDKEARKCDLLEVYNDVDKQELRKISGVNWDFIDIEDASGKSGDGEFDFSTSTQRSEYEELLKISEGENMKLQITPAHDMPTMDEDDEDEINVDDI